MKNRNHGTAYNAVYNGLHCEWGCFQPSNPVCVVAVRDPGVRIMAWSRSPPFERIVSWA